MSDDGLASVLAAGDAMALGRILTEDPHLVWRPVPGTRVRPLCLVCLSPGLEAGQAVAAGLVECIEVLLAAGAEPNVPCATPEGLVMPLAAAARNPEAARLLEAAGARLAEESP